MLVVDAAGQRRARLRLWRTIVERLEGHRLGRQARLLRRQHLGQRQFPQDRELVGDLAVRPDERQARLSAEHMGQAANGGGLQRRPGLHKSSCGDRAQRTPVGADRLGEQRRGNANLTLLGLHDAEDPVAPITRHAAAWVRRMPEGFDSTLGRHFPAGRLVDVDGGVIERAVTDRNDLQLDRGGAVNVDGRVAGHFIGRARPAQRHLRGRRADREARGMLRRGRHQSIGVQEHGHDGVMTRAQRNEQNRLVVLRSPERLDAPDLNLDPVSGFDPGDRDHLDIVLQQLVEDRAAAIGHGRIMRTPGTLAGLGGGFVLNTADVDDQPENNLVTAYRRQGQNRFDALAAGIREASDQRDLGQRRQQLDLDMCAVECERGAAFQVGPEEGGQRVNEQHAGLPPEPLPTTVPRPLPRPSPRFRPRPRRCRSGPAR